MTNLFAPSSVRKIKFFDTFYCVGFDYNKVSNGIIDETKLFDIDKSQNWNKEIVACKKIFYRDINKTKKQIIKINSEIMNYQVI